MQAGFELLVSEVVHDNAAGSLNQMAWSSNSELLAVVLSAASSSSQASHKDIMQVWHRSNWHWYLKQEQVYSSAQGLRVCWDEVAPFRLHICSGVGWYKQVCILCHQGPIVS